MEKEITFKEMFQSPILKKGKGKIKDLEAEFGENNVKRLFGLGCITSRKPKTWYRPCEIWYMNHWFLTKQGKRSVKLFDDRYTIWDRINDFIVVYILFGKTRFDRIRETISMMDTGE